MTSNQYSATDALAVTVLDEGDFSLVKLAGSAGTEESEKLEQRLTELSSGVRHLVLDLSELSFLNSAGLGAMVAAHRRCREQGGGLFIVQPQASVAQVLRITHLDRLLTTFNHVDEARQAIFQPPQGLA